MTVVSLSPFHGLTNRPDIYTRIGRFLMLSFMIFELLVYVCIYTFQGFIKTYYYTAGLKIRIFLDSEQKTKELLQLRLRNSESE